jgi:hypothetical protein
VKPRGELLERETLAREHSGDEAVDRVLSAARSYGLPRGKSERHLPVEDVLRPTAKVTLGTLFIALREAPLVVVVLIAVFITSESWQFFARLDAWQYAKVIFGFGVVIAVVLVFGLRTEARTAYTIGDDEPGPSEIEQPLADAGFGPPPAGLTAPALSRLLAGATQAGRLLVECAVVGLAAAGLFLLLGAIGASPELVSSWATRPGEEAYSAHTLFEISWLGEHAETVTRELMLVSGALGAIAALSFSIELVTGQRLREELLRTRFVGYGMAFRAWARLHHGSPPPIEPSPAPR